MSLFRKYGLICVGLITAMSLNAQQNPWEQIDPIGPDAKIVSNPLPYHLIIPGALIVGGGSLAAILAATREDPEPVVPEEIPEPEDPVFTLMNDAYSIFCGQTLHIFPLLNDVGTGLAILEITGAPEGIQLLNDSTIFISSTLSGDASFSVEIGDAVGQLGISTITITVEEGEITANGEVFEISPGETVTGNVLQNDLCFGCVVIDVSGNDENFTVQENGDFEYTAPDDFFGEATYTVTIENPCGAQDAADVVFIVNPEPPCAFEWNGSIQIVPAGCGQSNGAAFATEELFGPYNFSWSNGVNVPENEDISSGEYELIVTDTTFGCTDTLVAVVDELPADYGAEASVIEGGCGQTDNIQLSTNADVENPLTISLSGATSGVIDNVTDPSVILGDVIELNAGSLTITIWSEQQGAECAQSLEVFVGEGPPIPELVVAEVVQPQPPENIGTIVLDLINAALPADVIVNGEVFTTALAPQAILDGLPPGFYLISVVDFEGCASLPVEVLLEGQGINPTAALMRLSAQSPGLTNWINAPGNEIIMQTKEGQNYYTPVASPAVVPVSIEWTVENWKFSGAYGKSVLGRIENGVQSTQQVTYFEFGAGNSIDVRRGRFSFTLGYSEWQMPAANKEDRMRAGFVEGVFGWPVQDLSGRLQVGARAGMLMSGGKPIVVPKLQWVFGQ